MPVDVDSMQQIDTETAFNHIPGSFLGSQWEPDERSLSRTNSITSSAQKVSVKMPVGGQWINFGFRIFCHLGDSSEQQRHGESPIVYPESTESTFARIEELR